MTAPGPPPDQPPEWLVSAVCAIERGNWRYILYVLEALDAYGEATAFYILLQAVAWSMRLQTLGDVTEARKQLGVAAQLLPRPMRRLARDGVTSVSALRPKPAARPEIPMLTWRAARVIWREQAELTALRTLLTREHTEARDVLIDAMIEWMRWVDYDPWSFALHAHDDLTGIGPTRAALCARASQLRWFVDPTEGDVSTTVWANLGGYRGLRDAALRRLAGSDLVPWASANPLIQDIPVRLGRRRAWEHAIKWLGDL